MSGKSRVKITAVSYRDISITLDPDLQYRLGLSLTLFFGKVNNEKWFFYFLFFLFTYYRDPPSGTSFSFVKKYFGKKNGAVRNYFFIFNCQLFLQGFETFEGALTFVRITHALEKKSGHVCSLWHKHFLKTKMKCGWDLRVSSKHISELYCQILLKVLMKVDLNFIHFMCIKVSKVKPRFNLCSKKNFFYQGSKLRRYLTNILSQFSRI